MVLATMEQLHNLIQIGIGAKHTETPCFGWCKVMHCKRDILFGSQNLYVSLEAAAVLFQKGYLAYTAPP